MELTVGDYYAEPKMADVDPAAFAAALRGNPAELGLLRTNFRTADPATLAAFKEALGADLTDDEFRAFLNTFQPVENLDVGTPADRARAATWGRIPRTYVRLASDTSVPPAIQDRTIREADALTPDNPFDVRTLEGSHLRWLVYPRPGRRTPRGAREIVRKGQGLAPWAVLAALAAPAALSLTGPSSCRTRWSPRWARVRPRR